jgi:hypothetical protein
MDTCLECGIKVQFGETFCPQHKARFLAERERRMQERKETVKPLPSVHSYP